MKKRGKNSENAELWHHATLDVKPLTKKDRKRPIATVTKPRTTASTPPTPPPPTPSSVVSNVPPTCGFDRQTVRKIKRGRMTIESRIDLHGMTQAQAYDALDRFIAAAAGQRLVLVITGKGCGSGAAGVLRRNVPRWLKEIPSRDRIIGYCQADPKDGGAGALYVRLKKIKE